MSRKQVEDLGKVNLGGAARQVNTFVAAPRVARTNSALQLAQSLSGIAEGIQEQQQLDVQAATDQKLYGASVYADNIDLALFDYEERKDTLRSLEDAEAYFLEATANKFDDPHAAAGYEEKRAKGLSRFLGKHAQHLAGVRVQERSEYILKDFLATVGTDGIEAAEARKLDVAKNYNISPKELNQMTLNAAGILIAQGKLDDAQQVLDHKRGASGTLLENPETAEAAAQLNKKLNTARKDVENARVAAFKAQRETDALQMAQNEVNFTDQLDNEETTYEQKILELNKMDVLGQVSDDYASEARRYLKAKQDTQSETNSALMSEIVERIYDINEIADSNPKDYLRGINEIQKEIIALRSDKQLNDEDEASLKKRIKTLTSPKVAEATKRISRSFRDAKKLIDNQLPPSYRGEAIRQLFYDVDEEAMDLEEQGGSKEDIRQLYKSRAIQVIENLNTQRRTLSTQRVGLSSTVSKEDQEFVETLGYSMDDVKAQASSANMTEPEVINILRAKFKDTEVPQRQPRGDDQRSEVDQILFDEGVVKDDNGNHLAYLDHKGNLTGGHGHLLTPEEQAKYPEGTPIPKEVVMAWKEQDLKEAEEDVEAIFGEVKNPEARKVLKNMAFNLGRTRLNQFTRLKRAIENEDYRLAAQSMRESLWYKQVGGRSKRLVARIEALAET